MTPSEPALTQTYPFRNLVFQGGGVKAFAYLGALEVLETENILTSIERVAGSSAGAIIALLVSLRLSVAEMTEVFKTLELERIPERLTNPHPGWIERSKRLDAEYHWFAGNLEAVSRVLRKFGWSSLNYQRQWLRKLVAQFCPGYDHATFADFQRLGYRDLYFVATNLSTRKAEVFSVQTTPEVAVADALLLSQSLPLYFEAPRFDGKSFGRGSYYADGSLLQNFPLHLFDSAGYASNNPCYLSGINYQTLGFRLYSPADCPSEHPREITNLISYLERVLEVIRIAQDVGFEVDPAEHYRTISISDCCIPLIDLSLKVDDNHPDYQKLIESGRKAAQHYFTSYQLPNTNHDSLGIKPPL